MKKNIYIGCFLMASFSAMLSGCITHTVPPEKQKNYALLIPANDPSHNNCVLSVNNLNEINDPNSDYRACQKSFSASFVSVDKDKYYYFNKSIDVLPGKHTVVLIQCDYEKEIRPGRCNHLEESYVFTADAGYAYRFNSSKVGIIQVYDRFNLHWLKNLVRPQNALYGNEYVPSESKEGKEIKEELQKNAARKQEDQERINNCPQSSPEQNRQMLAILKNQADICSIAGGKAMMNNYDLTASCASRDLRNLDTYSFKKQSDCSYALYKQNNYGEISRNYPHFIVK